MLRESTPSADMQSVYSTAATDRAIQWPVEQTKYRDEYDLGTINQNVLVWKKLQY